MLLDTPVCDFGWPAPDFQLSTPDGTTYRLNDLCGKKGLLVCFICNHCPFVKAIITRLVADAKTCLPSLCQKQLKLVQREVQEIKIL